MDGKLLRRLTFVLCSLLLLAHTSCRYRPRGGGKKDTSTSVRKGYREEADKEEREDKKQMNGKNVIPMEYVNGVYYLKVEVNDIPMKFIFDTGASIISISQAEAMFLYKQGTLTDEDFMGSVSFQDANGDVSEGTIARLRKVKVGSFVLHDVEASIVPNQRAPLLFGQSALKQFGRISIDNNKHQLILE